MKIMKRLYILFLIFSIWSCDTSNMFVGGGTAPDISAPEIGITTPENLAYQSGSFFVAGTVTDNVKVTKVELSVFCNGERVSDKGNPPTAVIAGNQWSYKFENLKSGEYTITATAFDKAGNQSENSSKTIVVTVDNEESEVKIQKPNLKPQETLVGLNYREYAYIEYFKNKTFSIQGQVKDGYPLKEITLQLFKENECVYSLKFDSKYLGRKAGERVADGSLYNWTVTVDSEQELTESEAYTNKLSTLSATEKHYLKMAVTVIDKAGNQTMASDSQLGFVCLYQEADRPWIDVSSLETADNLEMQQEINKLRAGAQISGTAYDDDSLEMLEFYIVNTDYNEMVKHEIITKASFGETGCTMWDLVAPTNQGRYRLYYRLKDSAGVPSYGNDSDSWTEASGWDDEHSIGFQVIDESAPTTEVKPFEEYPTEAYITAKNPAFIVEATTRDAAGIEKVLLAWDPNLSEEKAVTLKQNVWDIDTNGYHDGIKYWIVDLKDFENVMENNTFKMDWSCELPVGDFTDEKGNKVFDYRKMYYCTVSKSGNYAVGTFTIPKEFNEPVLSIDSPKDNDNVRNVGGEHFTIEGKCSDAQSGITSLRIEYTDSNGNPGEYDLLQNKCLAPDGTWSVTSDKLTKLGGSYQRIIAKASDSFGNISQASVYVKVDNNSPQVVSVNVEELGGYYSVDKILHFTVTMNREIEIKGDKESIYLELNCRGSGKEAAHAKFDGFEEEKILKFKYTVQAGDKAEPLDYLSENSLKMGEGTKIFGKALGEGVSSVPAVLKLSEPGKAGSLSSRGVFIDTEKPVVDKISADVGQGAYTVGKEIRITAQFNEIINGRARILLNSRGNDATNTDLFVATEKEVKNSDTLEFLYTVKEGDNTEENQFLDIYVPFYAYSDTETVKDNAGNEMDFFNFPKNTESGSLAELKIKIDTKAPTFNGVYVSDVSIESYEKNGKNYYLNAGKTVTLEARFSENVVLGDEQPYLELNMTKDDKPVRAQYKTGAGSSILYFIYTVAAGDDTAGKNLHCDAFVGKVTDEAGNRVVGSTTIEENVALRKAISNGTEEISIIIDTTKPDAPTFTFKGETGNDVGGFTSDNNQRAMGYVYTGKATGYIENITITPKPADGEVTSKVKMYASIPGKTEQEWKEINEYTTVTDNAEHDWTVKAQLVDYAGNMSDVSSATFKVDKGVPLFSSITTTATNGLYKADTQIPVTLTFSKKVNAVKSGTDDIKLTFNNDGYVTFNASNEYSAMHKGTYFVGTGDNDINDASPIDDVKKLQIKEIIGGIFSDTAGNKVAAEGDDCKLVIGEGFTDDFKTKNIQIDKTAPKFDGYKIESISDENHSDSDSYYLNAGDTVKIAAVFEEPVMISGDSKIELSHGKSASYVGTSSDRKTLYYTYTVAGGENSASLCIATEVIPNNVQDIAGNKFETKPTEATTLKHNKKTIVIDTDTPAFPTVTLKKTNGETVTGGEVSEQLTMNISGENGAKIEYSITGGAGYDIGNTRVLGDTGSKKTFYIVARQTDKAGNMSKPSAKITITIDLQEMGISMITTTKANGTYKVGDKIPITLLFTKKVKFSKLKLTLNNGKELGFADTNTFAISHQAVYTIASNEDTTNEALKATALAGTFTDESNTTVNDKISASFANLRDNFNGNEILIDTIAPTIDSYSIESIRESIGDEMHTDTDGNYYLNAGDTVKIKVTFSEKVGVVGTSVLSLNSGENAVYLSNDDKTLIYEYKVAAGTASPLSILQNVYPTNIQDVAGNTLSAGLSETILKYNEKNIVIDTTEPATPTVSINGNSNASSFTQSVGMTIGETETNAKVEFSLDAGGSYETYTGAITLPKVVAGNNELNTFNVLARQTDIAGNVSSVSQMKTVVVDLRPTGLKSITTTKPSGVYKAGVLIPLTLEFHKAIKSDSNVTLTLSNGAQVTFKPDGKSVYTVNYTTASEDDVDALFVENFAGTIIDSATGASVTSFVGVDGSVNAGVVNGTITATNLPKTGNVITIDTKAPKLTGYTVNSLGGTPVIDSKNYLNAGDTVEIAAVFGEAVTISGDSTVTLNNNKKAVYTGTSDDKMTLYYTYTVSGGDDIAKLGVESGVYPNNIQDIAGNTLSAGLADATTLKHDSRDIEIDTVCATPTLDGISAGKIYNAAQKVTLKGETGATFYYSVDGGANSQQGQSFSTPTTEGRHPITAYQVDIAGNKSLWANVIEIIVDTAPPAIKSISTTAGSGSYKKGDKFTIVVEFTENVKTGNIEVSLNTGATVTFNITDGNTATTTYTAESGHNTDGLKASSVSGSITDIAGNNVTTFDNSFENFAGKTIKIDTTAPEITGFSMTPHSGSETTGTLNTILQNRATDSNIILNFNEGVSKGSGSIKIERVYKSYPAVMEVDDYNTHKAKISDWYIQRCIGTVNNNGDEPDTNAKYVLKYDIDHGAYASASDISNSTQKAVYNYFADKEYNVTTIDVNSGLVAIGTNSSTNATSVVTIKLPSKLQKGIIYKVTFTAGTFMDMVGNECAAESGSKVRFETGPTATPVIRINKKSGQGSGNQPYTTNVKVSSEMHDAELYFAQSNNPVDNDSNSVDKVKNPTSFASYSSEETLKVANDQDGAIFKLWAKTTKDGLTAGEVYKELAYKTVIKLGSSHYVRGSDSTGGVSATTEFPASWYDSLSTAQGGSSCWVTWHILKSFQWKEYDPKASIENNIDKRWIGSENEVTKPGSCDSIDAEEVSGGGSSGDSGNTGSSDGKIYLKPNSNWLQAGARFAAYFYGNGDKWVSMTYVSSGLYVCDKPAGSSGVIFCRMNPNKVENNFTESNNNGPLYNRTGDLSIPTNGDNCFTLKEGVWTQMSGDYGSWSKQ